MKRGKTGSIFQMPLFVCAEMKNAANSSSSIVMSPGQEREREMRKEREREEHINLKMKPTMPEVRGA